MDLTFPIWDKTGTSILLDVDGKEFRLDYAEISQRIGKKELGVVKGRGSRLKKIVLREPSALAYRLQQRSSLPIAEPLCVLVSVGDTRHVYMHVAQRCESFYDGRAVQNSRISSRYL